MISEKVFEEFQFTQYDYNSRFKFCLGEIGLSNFNTFLDSLPKIDIVYAALPKPENFPFWYKLAKKPRISHEVFFKSLTQIWKRVDASEYHIEVGPSNITQTQSFFNEWDNFEYYYKRDIRYSAPLNGTTLGMAKCRNPTQIVIYSKKPLDIPYKKYSHQYVDYIFNRENALNCFDPVIGKGLAVRSALKYGHACFGIEMNKKRLDCTIEYLQKYS